MNKLFAFLVALLATTSVYAQSEGQKRLMELFVTQYNAENYEEIFNHFSSKMQEALPLEKTKGFFQGLKAQEGRILSKEFIEYQGGSYAVYKTTFEKGVLAVNLSTDDDGKINGLFIKPYQDKPRNGVSAANLLNDYPKNIADAMFSAAKYLPERAELSVAVIENGKVQYYGAINENKALKSISNRGKIFEIGSMTKVFTSTILAALVNAHKIALTDAINQYYPYPFHNNVQITFESLANHTSGLPRLPTNLDISNTENPYKNYDAKKLRYYLENSMVLDVQATNRYNYSNLGAGLLGYTLGLTQHTSLQELYQQMIFDKYRMKNSFTNSHNLAGRLVKGLNSEGREVANWDFDVLLGAGGILSTTEDLANFAVAHFDTQNKDLALTRKATYTVNDKMQIGLGWHILTRDGKNYVWHNGGTGGYSSSMAIDTEKKRAVIILSNVADINNNIDELCFALMKTD